MNDYYDYMIIRIYGWYQSFENEPSLFTARLIIAIHQSVLILCLLAALNSLIVMPRLVFTTIGVNVFSYFLLASSHSLSRRKLIGTITFKVVA